MASWKICEQGCFQGSDVHEPFCSWCPRCPGCDGCVKCPKCGSARRDDYLCCDNDCATQFCVCGEEFYVMRDDERVLRAAAGHDPRCGASAPPADEVPPVDEVPPADPR